MIGKGNSSIRLCVQNLMRTFKGEVPYDRLKGLNPRLIDKPFAEAEPKVRQDAEMLIKVYEPRATTKGITVSQNDAVGGGFVVDADISGWE